MTRFILLFTLITFFFSCQSRSEQVTVDQDKKVLSAKFTSEKVAVKNDTIIPKSPRYNVIIDQARPKNQIDQTYPFDIEMKDIEGNVFESSEIMEKNGKPTILLFWLTTCYPCRLELNAIDKVYESWQQEADFNMVVVSTDFQKNFGKFVDRVNEEQWPWKTYHDSRREFRHVMPGGLNGLPQVFVFDSKGEIIYHKRKYYSGDEHKLFDAVKKAS